MATGKSWKVNSHTTRHTDPMSVVLQLRLVSGWGPWIGDQCCTNGLWPVNDFSLLLTTSSKAVYNSFSFSAVVLQFV